MSLKNSLIVLWVYIMYVLGMWLFLSGYLLKRIVVHQNSDTIMNFGANIDCTDIIKLRRIVNSINNMQNKLSYSNKTYLQQYDKAIILVIDALRFDFVMSSNPKHGNAFFEHKMPVFKQMIERNPDKSLLFRLTADPPTTTMQRLKGLTTGSLPTFIDVSLNFASTEITEDNLIFQLKKADKRVVFMGDDTWEGLFPDKFYRSFPYPSFNVKDLDTVDEGILQHLYEEIDKNDYDVIIAHFLGVDHCGHRYGPNHPEMTRKLQQMNGVIQNTTARLKNDTILLVLGDHGMTESGDHGGDSLPEVSTALFFYSPSELTNFAPVKDVETVNQVDIVPTLSLLLGLPIPFSNLGSVITPVFQKKSQKSCFDLETQRALTAALATAENAMQVQKYISTYSEASSELSDLFVTNAQNRLEDLNKAWFQISNNMTKNRDILLNISLGYKQYLEEVRSVCSSKWATFDMNFIFIGITLLCVAIFCNFCVADKEYKNFLGIFFTLIIIATVAVLYTVEIVSTFMLCDLGIIVLSFALKQFVVIKLKYFYVCVFCILLVSVVVALFSDLYLFNFLECFFVLCLSASIVFYNKVINVETVCKIFTLPCFITFILFIMSFSNSFVVHEDKIIMYLLQSAILYRFLTIFSVLFKHNSNKSKIGRKSTKTDFKWMLQPLCLVCLMLTIRLGTVFYKCREEQEQCENSNFIISLEKLHQNQAYKVMRLMLSLFSQVLPVVIFLGILCYRYTAKSQTVCMISVKYGVFFVCVLTSLRWWLNIVPPSVVERILKGNEVMLNRTACLTCVVLWCIILVFPILVEKPWENLSKEIYFSSLASLIFIVLQFLYLTGGDALSTAIMLMALSVLLYIALVHFALTLTEPQPRVWLDVLIWCLLTRHWFYSTSHQATFTSIQWDAAFMLTHKDISSYILSGALVLVNTFSSHIFHGLALPVILILQEASYLTSKSVLRLHMKYLFYAGVKFLGTVCAAFILRRHLMVWKIFSPKLLYEAIGVIITMLSASIGHFFIIKVMSHYHRLIRLNLNHMFADKNE